MTPTVGRVVLVRSNNIGATNAEPNREVPALITRVWSDTCINVHILADSAPSTWATSVMMNDDPSNGGHTSWRWMPYQKAVAAGEIAPTLHAVAK